MSYLSIAASSDCLNYSKKKTGLTIWHNVMFTLSDCFGPEMSCLNILLSENIWQYDGVWVVFQRMFI